jgi:hypothetical protein
MLKNSSELIPRIKGNKVYCVFQGLLMLKNISRLIPRIKRSKFIVLKLTN